MKKIATLDVTKGELALIRDALGILAGKDILYELVPAGQDVRVASIVFLSGCSSRAKELWVRLQKWAPTGSVAGVVLGSQTGGKVVAADSCIKRPVSVDNIVSELEVLHLRGRGRKVSKLREDEAPLIAINSSDQAAAPAAEAERLLLSGRVLVVDDSETVRRHLKFALSRFGLDVDTADCGEDGLKCVVATSYDLVFLDVVMPGTDGFKICKTLKNSPNLRELPVIMLTSKSSPFDKVRGALSGCDSYLTKPVELGLLQEVLKQHLSGAVQIDSSGEDYAATVVIEPIDFEGAEA